jgi:hypothetical protein
VSVMVANGQKITSDKQVAKLTWWTQGHIFTHSARVLPISCFDLVLGMDWLEHYTQCGSIGRGTSSVFHTMVPESV